MLKTKKKIEICESCPLHKHNLENVFPLPGEREKSYQIAMVGEAPAKEEYLQGIPFVGRSGKMLWGELKKLDCHRESFFVTNALKCKLEDKFKASDVKQAIKVCSEYLFCELKHFNLNKVILLGAKALYSVVGTDKIGQNRGQILKSEHLPGVDICPTFHPAAVMYNARIKRFLPKDLNFFINGEDESIKVEKTSYRLITEFKEALQILENLEDNQTISLDLETTSLDHWRGEIILVGVGIKIGKAYAIHIEPWPHKKESYHDKQSFYSHLDKIIKQKNITVVYHNAKFDMRWLISVGVPCQDWLYHDTIMIKHMLDENDVKDLKSLAQLYTNMGNYAEDVREEISDGKGKSFGDIDIEKLATYNCADCDASLRLFEILLPKLKKLKKTYNHYLEWLMLIYPVIEAEMWGFSINTVKQAKYNETLLRQAKKEYNFMVKDFGEEFNPGSFKQLSKILYGELKLPVLNRTPKGNPSTDKDTVELLNKKLGDNPFLNSLVRYRHINNINSTFVVGLSQHLDAKDSRTHAHFQFGSHRHGRINCKQPNLCNQPRDEDSGDMSIRSMFIASSGGVLCCGDFSQIEMIVSALLAKERVMLDILKAGGDIHTETARSDRLYGKEYDNQEKGSPRQKNMRSVAKGTNFGVIYGATYFAVMELMTSSPLYADKSRKYIAESAKDFINNYFKVYPKIAKRMREVPKLALKQGYLESIFGRRKHIKDRESLKEEIQTGKRFPDGEHNQAINFEPQSIAAWITLQAFKRIQLRLINANIPARCVNIIYDQIIIDIKNKKYRFIVRRIMLQEMLKPISELHNAVFPVEIGFGDNWSDADRNTIKHGVFTCDL